MVIFKNLMQRSNDRSYDGVFTTAQYKSLLPTGIPNVEGAHPESVHNNFEVNIAAGQELNKFYRRLIFLLMLFQTITLLTVVSYFCARIAYLEAETSKLRIFSAEKNPEISDLFQQIYEVRDECQDMFRMDCSMLGDIGSTESDQLDVIMNVEIDADTIEEDEDEEADQDRHRRGLSNWEMRRRRKLAMRPRARGKKTYINKRFQCQKCVAEDRKRPDVFGLPRKPQSNSPSPPLPDVSAVRFRGGLPEVVIKEKVVSGTIGPWSYDSRTNSSVSTDFRLEPNHSSVKVLNDGFYFIYAQVYYLTTGGSNSFSIVKKGNLQVKDETLATCSSGPGTTLTHGQEVSCFTATVGRLKRGDLLQLSERELNRRVLFRDGQTYFGLMRLSPTVLNQRQVNTSAL